MLYLSFSDTCGKFKIPDSNRRGISLKWISAKECKSSPALNEALKEETWGLLADRLWQIKPRKRSLSIIRKEQSIWKIRFVVADFKCTGIVICNRKLNFSYFLFDVRNSSNSLTSRVLFYKAKNPIEERIFSTKNSLLKTFQVPEQGFFVSIKRVLLPFELRKRKGA